MLGVLYYGTGPQKDTPHNALGMAGCFGLALLCMLACAAALDGIDMNPRDR